MNYVIIGNSVAAVGCIEGIRQVDKKGKITVVSNEKYHTYSRPLISYLLAGKTTEEKMKYRPNDFYEQNGVECVFGRTAVKIDKLKKEVILDDAKTISYDKLLVATGSNPFVPEMKNLDSVLNKATFMSLDDAKKVGSFINKESRVLIVGAGLIGLKCLEGIKEKVKSVTVVDLSDRILSSILDKDTAGFVQNYLEKQGVKFILNEQVKEFKADKAVLSGGSEIEFDLVVLAVGVRPNISLIKDLGGKTDRGILTDDTQLTSVKDIYSAGDCTESFDVSCDKTRILALLPNAYMQGEIAGKNMAGLKTHIEKLCPFNSIGLFGLHIVTAGSYDGEVYIDNNDGFKKLFYKDNLLKGFIIVGKIDRSGIYTNLIRNKVPLDSIDTEYIFKNPSLIALGREFRDKTLGGLK